MIRLENDCWKVTGPVTIETHLPLREAARATGVLPGSIDWTEVSDVDSSALSLLFVWQREAQAVQRTLTNINMPANLQTLAGLYGVAELIQT